MPLFYSKKLKKKSKKYCCLDIETSDFDPQKGEILELGMVFFEIDGKSILYTNEWNSVFHTDNQISPRILALTGIPQEEINNAPNFRDKSEEIQKLVEDCIIVGHNVSFDTKFLEAFGIKFAPGRLDTLDLAQFLLPMNKSYNLEALMAHFDISYKNAHRALADAKATVLVLEKFLMLYSGLSNKTKQVLKDLYLEGDEEIRSFLDTAFQKLSYPKMEEVFKNAESVEIDHALGEKKGIISFPLGFSYYSYALTSVKKVIGKKLVLVPSENMAYKAWRSGMGYALLGRGSYFNSEKFAKALEAPGKDAQTRLLLAKITVWQEVGWQKENLIGVNLSFFSSQYRNLVCGNQDAVERKRRESKEKNLIVDYNTFIEEGFEWLAGRKLIVFDVNNFEAALTRWVNKKVSWRDFLFAASEFKEPKDAQMVEDSTKFSSDVDLFFGLAIMKLQKLSESGQYLLVTENIRNTVEFDSINKAAQTFLEKIDRYNTSLKSEKIGKLSDLLKKFFFPEDGQIYWIEISADHLSFHYSPDTLTNVAEEKIGNYDQSVFLASLGSKALLSYFEKRLNIKNHVLHAIGQQELRGKFSVKLGIKIPDTTSILALLDEIEYPAALLLPNMSAVQDFYENNFIELRKKMRVSAQNYSGGSNKLLENFSIEEKSLFIGTDRFILKNVGRKLMVKTLIISRLPFEQFTHPLIAAQSQKYSNAFEEFTIPRALYNFHSLINFFYTDDLKEVYITDAKINKEYGKYFIEYLESLPFVEIFF